MGRLPSFGFRSDLFDGGVTSGEVCVDKKKSGSGEHGKEREWMVRCPEPSVHREAMFTQHVLCPSAASGLRKTLSRSQHKIM